MSSLNVFECLYSFGERVEKSEMYVEFLKQAAIYNAIKYTGIKSGN